MSYPTCVVAVSRPFHWTICAISERPREDDRRNSVRRVAGPFGIEPAYLSRIERQEVPPTSELTSVRLTNELGEAPDVMLALAAEVSADLQAIVHKRPRMFADLIR